MKEKIGLFFHWPAMEFACVKLVQGVSRQERMLVGKKTKDL